MVPHLRPRYPVHYRTEKILDNATAIEHWMRAQWQDHLPPFYADRTTVHT